MRHVSPPSPRDSSSFGGAKDNGRRRRRRRRRRWRWFHAESSFFALFSPPPPRIFPPFLFYHLSWEWSKREGGLGIRSKPYRTRGDPTLYSRRRPHHNVPLCPIYRSFFLPYEPDGVGLSLFLLLSLMISLFFFSQRTLALNIRHVARKREEH